jgi:hypothetical protein
MPDHPINPPIGKVKNKKNYSSPTKISTNINFWILVFLFLYIVNLTMYTWIGTNQGENKEEWNLFYFFNENFIKVIIPLLIANIITIKFIRNIFYGIFGFQLIAFIFSLLELLDICSNIVLYKILTLTGALILMGMIYVSIRKLHKK